MTRNKAMNFWSSSGAIPIGKQSVGAGQRVYIIAEAGVNHCGRYDLAIKLVEAAKRAGADAVKFQVFTADNLVIPDTPTANYQVLQGHIDQRKMLRQLELSRKEFSNIFAFCKELQIEFLATPFGIDDLEFLIGLGVNCIKLASPDLVNTPLVKKTLESNLPVIASCGASVIEEIDQAVKIFADNSAINRLILLHCVSSYPTLLRQANLSVIGHLAHRYPVPVGFSDHTAEWITGALAVTAGAAVLEKHFTLDRSMQGPDHAFSLEEKQLTQYIEAAREAQLALGEPQKQLLACETEVRKVARSSIVSVVGIPALTIITHDMLAVKRPGGGIEPGRIDDIIGAKTRVDIPIDTRIDWSMIMPSQ